MTSGKEILGVEAADGFYYRGDFVFAELGVDGQGEDFLGGAFGYGEVAGFVAQGFEAFLQVERERVVDFGADFVGGQMGAQVVAAGARMTYWWKTCSARGSV